MARQLEAAGAHILGIADMAGLCKPQTARALVSALRQEVGIPVHFHTHDTAGAGVAAVLAAAEAGVDAADAAMDPMSGLASQPSLNATARPCSARRPRPASAVGRSTRWPTTGRRCGRLCRLRKRHARRRPPRALVAYVA
jgi:pyruvate carboxylase